MGPRGNWPAGRGLLLCALFAVVAAAGCVQVAGSLFGAGLFAAASHAVRDTSENTVALPMSEAEAVVRAVLADLDVSVIEVQHKRSEGQIARCTIEGSLVGDDLISVDVVLERLSGRMTKVYVTATRGWLRPELETARRIQACIARAAAGAPLLEDEPPLPTIGARKEHR